jgi:undecaprenyl pyrophosphate synthase
MKLSLNNAKEEFKRCDHLLYVSLKYTRTVDVVKSLIARMLTCYEFAMNTLLLKKKKEVPSQVGLKIDMVKELYADNPIVMDNIVSFIFLRKIDKLRYKVENEYRRHVHLIADLEGKTYKLGIDEMTYYYLKIKDFLEYMEETLI